MLRACQQALRFDCRCRVRTADTKYSAIHAIVPIMKNVFIKYQQWSNNPFFYFFPSTVRKARTKYRTIHSIALHLFYDTNRELLTMDISRHSSTSKEEMKKIAQCISRHSSTSKEMKKIAQCSKYQQEDQESCTMEYIRRRTPIYM